MDIKELINDYVNGMKTKDMTKKYRCSTTTISQIIDENGIPRRVKKANRHKDLSKFYDTSLPETQYWLGYICADGNIQYDEEKKHYRVVLFSKDIEVIESFISYAGKDNVGTHTRKQNGIKEVYICSKELAYYFTNDLKITPNKSLTLDPNIIYSSHFIRGYFDGDGCIRKSYSLKTRNEAKFTSGSRIFLEKIQKELSAEGIVSTISTRKDCNANDLLIYNKENIKLLFDFLYKDASVYLTRKYDIFVALCEKSTDENRVNCKNIVENLQPSQPLTKLEGSTTND